MVTHASEYPWSSYQYNGAGKAIALRTPHPCYLSLGADNAERQGAYRVLFRGCMTEASIGKFARRRIGRGFWAVIVLSEISNEGQAVPRDLYLGCGDRNSVSWDGAQNR